MEQIRTTLETLQATAQKTTTPTGCTDSKTRILNAKKYFKHLLDKRIGGNFVIEPAQRKTINDIFFYICNRPQLTSLDCSKGLMLCGTVGTGKTSLLYAMRQFLVDTIRDGFPIFNVANDVVQFYAQKGDIGKFITDVDPITGHHEAGTMAFDELGREAIPANHYGTKLNVMEQIIQSRYSYYTTERAKTHFTTNCNAADLERIYGDYILDRLKEMCNWVALTGTSHRK